MSDQDDKLDEMGQETFPASDPPGNTVETGIRLGSPDVHDRAGDVRDNVDLQRFEIAIDGQTAFLTYERKPNAMVFIHTEVPPPLQGRGLANVLAKAGLEAARAEGLMIVAVCPVVRAYLVKHPQLR